MKRIKRNMLKRKSSPKGIKQRQEIRINNTPPSTPKFFYHKPGSANLRKVGR